MSDTPQPTPDGAEVVRRALRDARALALPIILADGAGADCPGSATDRVDVVDPKAPLQIARQLVARAYEKDGAIAIRHWRADFLSPSRRRLPHDG